ncbi:MAG: serine hydrolase [Candidatus Baltobacteraceae bacterium]
MVHEVEARQALQEASLDSAQVVLKALDGAGPALEVDPDTYLYPASMLKTPLAAVALELVECGELRLDQSFDCSDRNMTTNDAESPFVTGFRGPLSLIVERALTHSDNVATNMLYDICGRERATEMAAQKLGLADTAFHRKLSGSEPLIVDPQWDGVNRNRHSARDAARLFELIATDALPYAALLREILAKQQFNDKLSKGLGTTDHFAHKTGDTDEVTHDGGILTLSDGRRYVLVVYTGLESTPEHNARFAPFMRAIRPLL